MKAKTRLLALAAALSAFACIPSLAADNAAGAYLGAGVGYAKHAVDGCDRDCSDSDTGFKVLAGYQFNPYFALEASYTDLGKIKASAPGFDASLATTAFTFAAVGMVPMGADASFLAKAGMHASKSKFRSTDNGVHSSSDDNHSGLLLGLGAQYKFTSNLIGRIEWEWLNNANRIGDDKGNVNLVSANLIYKF
jgi:OOP family OmpA-OmpF porin